MQNLVLLTVIAPLLGALLSVPAFRLYGQIGAYCVAIAAVFCSFITSSFIAWEVFNNDLILNFDWYLWGTVGDARISIGFLVDSLSAIMILVVTFVSLMVHIYTVGYMAGDPGYGRFFAYICLFTFSMLMLVLANNFLQLFFGWEAVGLVSYLLIGFWFTRPTATYASLKAFLVNRVGDLGFLLGIGLVLAVFGSLDYAEVFANANTLSTTKLPSLPPGWDVATTVCILLFIGAMGKSAQFPLHVWLPDSMEGPTPISALIHAATMVTAGIFMVARMSPLFELSETALTVVLLTGAITAFFMGILGLVQNDIKRIVAYSTLSQLGYMTVALGASAYSAAIFHLFTHAFFKALLFLGAGSVIIAMHHEQDIRKMGGLRRYMPITYATMLLGTLALTGLPPFSGFFSKDLIIDAVKFSELPMATFVHWVLVIGAFITALYSFRLLILTFHGNPRMDSETKSHLHETSQVITIPLILLAIPSVLLGGLLLEPLIFGNLFSDSIFILEAHDTVATVQQTLDGKAINMVSHAISNPAFYATLVGIAVSIWLYLGYPYRTHFLAQGFIHRILLEKYGLDRFNDFFFAGGMRKLGDFCWRKLDTAIIDSFFVNGSARVITWFAFVLRRLQTGAVYHYAFVMLMTVALILLWRLGVLKS